MLRALVSLCARFVNRHRHLVHYTVPAETLLPHLLSCDARTLMKKSVITAELFSKYFPKKKKHSNYARTRRATTNCTFHFVPIWRSRPRTFSACTWKVETYCIFKPLNWLITAICASVCSRIIVVDHVLYCFGCFRSSSSSITTLYPIHFSYSIAGCRRVHIRSVQVYWLKNLSASANPMSCTCHPMFDVHAVCVYACILFRQLLLLSASLRSGYTRLSFISFRSLYCILCSVRHLSLSRCVLTMDLDSVALTLPPIQCAPTNVNHELEKENREL